MAKTKYIMHLCAYCRKETKMEFVGNQPMNIGNTEISKKWYRCTKCKHSALLTVSPENHTRKQNSIIPKIEECTIYAKEKTFSVGEFIYFAEWDDMGQVIRKDKTSNGINSIVVSFSKNGERRLLENMKSDSEDFIENRLI